MELSLNSWLNESLNINVWAQGTFKSSDYDWMDLNSNIFHLHKFDCDSKRIHVEILQSESVDWKTERADNPNHHRLIPQVGARTVSHKTLLLTSLSQNSSPNVPDIQNPTIIIICISMTSNLQQKTIHLKIHTCEKKNLNSTTKVHIMHCAMVYAGLYRLVKQFTSSWGSMTFCFKASKCILKTFDQSYYKIVRYNPIATIFCGSGTVTWSDLDSRYHNIQFFFYN